MLDALEREARALGASPKRFQRRGWNGVEAVENWFAPLLSREAGLDRVGPRPDNPHAAWVLPLLTRFATVAVNTPKQSLLLPLNSGDDDLSRPELRLPYSIAFAAQR
jgi:hypothetical protein